jgi:hypothetical protein
MSLKSITYNKIFDKPYKQGNIVSDRYVNNVYIYDTKIINVNNKCIIERDVINNTISTYNINFDYHLIFKIEMIDNYIFIVYSKNDGIYDFNWLAKINISNNEVNHYEFQSISSICIFNNHIFVASYINGMLLIIDFNGNTIEKYTNYNIIKFDKSKNFIIIYNMLAEECCPEIWEFNVSKQKYVSLKIFHRKSCVTFSKDEKIIYVYDNVNEELILYNTNDSYDWTRIKNVSMKLNESTFWYKNKYFNELYLFPNNKYILLNNKKSELWDIVNNKYIGTLPDYINAFKITNDDMYLIGITDDKYYVWDLYYGKYKMYKSLCKQNRLYLPDELWQFVEDYDVIN